MRCFERVSFCLVALTAIVTAQSTDDINSAHGLTFVPNEYPKTYAWYSTYRIPFKTTGSLTWNLTIEIREGAGPKYKFRKTLQDRIPALPLDGREFVWTVTNDIPPANDYFLAISQDDDDNYSERISVVKPGQQLSSTTSSAAISTTSQPSSSSTSLPSAVPASPKPTSNGLSIGAKIGIGLGIGAGLLIITAIIAAFYYRRRYRTLAKNATEGSVTVIGSPSDSPRFGSVGVLDEGSTGVFSGDKPELDAMEAKIGDDSSRSDICPSDSPEKKVELDASPRSPVGVFAEPDSVPVNEMEGDQAPIEKEAEVVELVPNSPSGSSQGVISPTSPGGHGGNTILSPVSPTGTYTTIDGTVVSELDSTVPVELPAQPIDGSDEKKS